MTMQIRDDRHMRALTGVSLAQFEILLAMFTTIYQQMQWQAYQTGLVARSRQRRPGGGKKGALPHTVAVAGVTTVPHLLWST